MSRENELGMGEASIDATNERLAGMDFSFNFKAAPEPKKAEDPKPSAAAAASSSGGFGNFSFGGGSIPSEPAKAEIKTRDGKRSSVYNPPKGSREEELGLAGASVEDTNKRLDNIDFSFNFDAKPAPKKEASAPAAAAAATAAPKKAEPLAGGFSSFSFGGGSIPSEPAKAEIKTRDGKRSSVYNPPKGSREEELGLAGASVEDTNKRLDNIDFSFNFNAPAKTPEPKSGSAPSSSGGGNSGAGSREEELGMGAASVEDTNARLANMSFSFGADRDAAAKKAKEAEEAKVRAIAEAEAAAAAKAKQDAEAEAAAIAFAEEQAAASPTFVYENVTPEWVAKVAEAQAVLAKDLAEDHPDRIAASMLAMQEAGRIDGMIAAMDYDPDDGGPAPAPPKAAPWAPDAVRASIEGPPASAPATSGADVPTPSAGEEAGEPVADTEPLDAAAAYRAAQAAQEAAAAEEESKPGTNYTEIYETVTLTWTKKLAEAQGVLAQGLPDNHPSAVAARVIALAESNRISGLVAAMDAEEDGRVPPPPTWTPWAPETISGYCGTQPDVASMAAAAAAAPAPAEETFEVEDGFGDDADEQEEEEGTEPAAYDNTDGFVAAAAATTNNNVEQEDTNPWGTAGDDDDAEGGGMGFDSNPVGAEDTNPWGNAGGDNSFADEQQDDGYNLVGDAGEIEDVDDAATAAAAAAAAKTAADAAEAAAIAAANREAEIAADAGGEAEVETFLKDLSSDLHKRVWPLLKADAIEDMATLGDMSKADLKGMGIKMGDASKILRGAEKWGC